MSRPGWLGRIYEKMTMASSKSDFRVRHSCNKSSRKLPCDSRNRIFRLSGIYAKFIFWFLLMGRAEMKSVKTLLLGTAAGLVAVAGAQAADIPVKAAPVQFVKICSLYGDGFYYIPGTDTCLKMGGYLRVQTEYNMGGGGVVVGDNSGGMAGQGIFTRDRTNDVNYRVRAVISYAVFCLKKKKKKINAYKDAEQSNTIMIIRRAAPSNRGEHTI